MCTCSPIAATAGATTGHRYANTGMAGADSSMRAASYDDWGWFLAELFDAHPDAWAGLYKGLAVASNSTRQGGPPGWPSGLPAGQRGGPGHERPGHRRPLEYLRGEIDAERISWGGR